MVMVYINWTHLYEKYGGSWVALDDDEETVVGSGYTPEEALHEAKASGHKDAALTFVAEDVTTFAG
jgi:Family of unknown function (DUF5678)